MGEPSGGAAGLLPELAAVPWRPLASERSLRAAGRRWTATTVAHTVPFVATFLVLIIVKPLTAPVALAALAHAWIIPELYAARGANVLRSRPAADPGAERTALGLLGDLVDHDTRALHVRTGLVVERGRFGVWVVGEAGALLVRAGGRRVDCLCVKATGDGLPSSDRIAHLLLALRADEAGFTTVANLAFSGARWRLHRRLPSRAREALAAAVARAGDPGGATGARELWPSGQCPAAEQARS